jgi:hypothetical protein
VVEIRRTAALSATRDAIFNSKLYTHDNVEAKECFCQPYRGRDKEQALGLLSPVSPELAILMSLVAFTNRLETCRNG